MPLSVTCNQVATCVHESLPCFKAINWYSAVDWVEDVDWFDELRLIGTAILMTNIIVSLIALLDPIFGSFPPWNDLIDSAHLPGWFKLPSWVKNMLLDYFGPGTRRSGRSMIGGPRRGSYQPSPPVRTLVSSSAVIIYAWPSKGGVIIHDHVERADLDFLDLDPLDPPSRRLPIQEDEDAFCKRLLLLGAKWWDSEERFRLLTAAIDLDDRAIFELEHGDEPTPTMREKQWVSVAWPTSGGLWVAEFDFCLDGSVKEEDQLPSDGAWLKLANNMEERSRILVDRFEARFFEDVKDYEGHAFINSWEWKDTGEVGPLSPLYRWMAS